MARPYLSIIFEGSCTFRCRPHAPVIFFVNLRQSDVSRPIQHVKMFSVLRFTRYFTHIETCGFQAFARKMKRRSKTVQIAVLFSLGQKIQGKSKFNVFSASRFRTLFVARNAFFQNLIFLQIWHVTILSIFVGKKVSPGLLKH